MESNDKLKEIDIESCTCYYFDGTIEFEDFDLDNILIDEKSYRSKKWCCICFSSNVCNNESWFI